jgi:hypothetical protein
MGKSQRLRLHVYRLVELRILPMPLHGHTMPIDYGLKSCVPSRIPEIALRHFLLVKVGFIVSVTLQPENLSTGFRGSLYHWGPIKAAQ